MTVLELTKIFLDMNHGLNHATLSRFDGDGRTLEMELGTGRFASPHEVIVREKEEGKEEKITTQVGVYDAATWFLQPPANAVKKQ